MALSFSSLAAALWIAWMIDWAIAGRSVKQARWRESIGSELLHQGPLVVAGTLLATSHLSPAALDGRFLPAGPVTGALGIVVLVLGLAFAVWARLHLGANWSSAVTVKDQHTLIRSGPYRYVRHPIYSGLLLGVVGTAIVIGQWRGLMALAIAFAALLYKSRVEERRMRENFPEYDSYRRTTAEIVPFLY